MVQEDPDVEHARSRVGRTLRGKWRVDRLIGVGGMAAVYAGTHRNGLRGAIKMLHVSLGASTDIRERFLREGYAANQVNHPGAVRVLDDDIAEDGAIFLVMELLAGQTVEARAAAHPHGVLPPIEVLRVADAALDVLAAAHDKGIVHRDVKPENLFITDTGEVKLLDFGIARVREMNSARATTTGALMGSPAFMSPEQASGQWSLVDGRTDLWAIGASMFLLLTGRSVHEAATAQLVMAATMTRPPRSLAAVMPAAPKSLIALVDRALAFDVGARWPTAAAMQRAVRQVMAELSSSTGGFPARPSSASGSFSSPGMPVATAISSVSVSRPTHGTTLPVSSGSRAAAKGGPKGLAFVAGVSLAVLLGVGWFVISRSSSPTPAASGTASAEPVPPPVDKPTSSASAAAVPAAVEPPKPTVAPSAGPSAAPSAGPSAAPSAGPSAAPSAGPSAIASAVAPPTEPRRPQRGRIPITPPPKRHEGIF